LAIGTVNLLVVFVFLEVIFFGLPTITHLHEYTTHSYPQQVDSLIFSGVITPLIHRNTDYLDLSTIYGVYLYLATLG